MKTIKTFTLMLCIAAMGLATACSKDDDSNNNSGSLVGTTWKTSVASNGDWAALQFTSATAVTFTGGRGEESDWSLNGTYTYSAPNGTMLFAADEDQEQFHYTFTINGNTLLLDVGDGTSMTFTRQ